MRVSMCALAILVLGAGAALVRADELTDWEARIDSARTGGFDIWHVEQKRLGKKKKAVAICSALIEKHLAPNTKSDYVLFALRSLTHVRGNDSAVVDAVRLVLRTSADRATTIEALSVLEERPSERARPEVLDCFERFARMPPDSRPGVDGLFWRARCVLDAYSASYSPKEAKPLLSRLERIVEVADPGNQPEVLRAILSLASWTTDHQDFYLKYLARPEFPTRAAAAKVLDYSGAVPDGLQEHRVALLDVLTRGDVYERDSAIDLLAHVTLDTAATRVVIDAYLEDRDEKRRAEMRALIFKAEAEHEKLWENISVGLEYEIVDRRARALRLLAKIDVPEGQTIAFLTSELGQKRWELRLAAVDALTARAAAAKPALTKLRSLRGDPSKSVRAAVATAITTIEVALEPERPAAAAQEHSVAAEDVSALPALELGEPVQELALSADGKRIAAAGMATLTVWDTATHREVRTISLEATKSFYWGDLGFSPDGLRIMLRTFDSVDVFEVASGELRTRIPKSTAEGSSHGRLRCFPAHDAAYRLDEDTGLRVFSAETGEQIWSGVAPQGLKGAPTPPGSRGGDTLRWFDAVPGTARALVATEFSIRRFDLKTGKREVDLGIASLPWEIEGTNRSVKGAWDVLGRSRDRRSAARLE